MIIEALAVNGLTMAGKSIFSHVIYDTYGLLKETTYPPEVDTTIAKLDLVADLEVIESLINTIEKCDNIEQTPLAISLKQVNDMVHQIKNELVEIKKVVEEHKKLYFANWRTPDYHIPLKRLRQHKDILDKRVTMLIELLKIIREDMN